ncbi:MAG: triose-phosphate isomerase [Armatimonadetes bacterium CG2_30_59_28]|nr:triose-phosphate isomerase [Armatimonadota bacterium]OIO92125.1 MAG: triose-phosphate isomerase [Armatimonadetes bacterium CG2_30_59_28]PIU65578.1 MAG: triose-phosphate isomerase [Armatimonadetes bacterium CG07_land_8_20_14_0_80_59_28]PIY39228.1 MAG: triose-phosphate isomerase [Armatimonadetes bacterium CG_4_10_14_3_um_filter_59_10]PJB62862.1 MAG: triose-phosphate isomerase [Armatimonadetes bacterium CG_4_9_14_3_um_filter_58_7]
MRTPFIAGNWKMNKTVGEAIAFVDEFRGLVAGVAGVDIALCPAFIALEATVKATAGTNIAVGAQGMFWKESGAYTGEVSPSMVKDVGCKYVIIGHSERRGRFGVPEAGMTEDLLKVFGDTDASVNVKSSAALQHDLTPIICVGETLDERQAGNADAVVQSQVRAALAGFTADQVPGVVLAYEPVWAIGTGETCESNEANRVCGLIRQTIAAVAGPSVADTVRVQYGGSVKPDNIEELIGKSDIDGALVGGASLKPDSFAALVKASAL